MLNHFFSTHNNKQNMVRFSRVFLLKIDNKLRFWFPESKWAKKYSISKKMFTNT